MSKLLCWGEYEIEVADKWNWIAWDNRDVPYLYEDEPRPFRLGGVWLSDSGWRSVPRKGRSPQQKSPEPGPWYEQLYWIGD